MQLFNLENHKTYQANTNRLKTSVLDVAIKDVNQCTEFNVWYKEYKKEYRFISGFEIRWQNNII